MLKLTGMKPCSLDDVTPGHLIVVPVENGSWLGLVTTETCDSGLIYLLNGPGQGLHNLRARAREVLDLGPPIIRVEPIDAIRSQDSARAGPLYLGPSGWAVFQEGERFITEAKLIVLSSGQITSGMYAEPLLAFLRWQIGVEEDGVFQMVASFG